MVSALKSFLAIAVIASVATSAFAIECYKCKTATQPKCADEFKASDNITKVECATGCLKISLKDNGQPRFIRDCYYGDVSDEQKFCQKVRSRTGVEPLSCDACTGNLCNGSSAMAPIAAAIVLFFALARMLS